MANAPLVHLLLAIDISGQEFADDAELGLRDQLVKTIESSGIGDVGGFGSGLGGMDISVLVPDEERGREQITAVLQRLAPGAKFTIEALPDED